MRFLSLLVPFLTRHHRHFPSLPPPPFHSPILRPASPIPLITARGLGSALPPPAGPGRVPEPGGQTHFGTVTRGKGVFLGGQRQPHDMTNNNLILHGD